MSKLLNFAWEQRAKLHAEGDKLWAEAVIAKYGNITMGWTATGCTLGNGKEFKGAV